MDREEIDRRYAMWLDAVERLEAAQAAGASMFETNRLSADAAKAKAELDAARGGDWEERRRVYVWGNPRG